MTNRMRRPVLDFAIEMEQRLLAHDDARGEQGWMMRETTDEFLFNRMLEEMAELHAAMYTEGVTEDAALRKIVRECADVANFAMMISDRAKSALKNRQPALNVVDR